MTEKEYKLLAKRTNQRLVTALNIGILNNEGLHIQQELQRLGYTRFPERMSRVSSGKLKETIAVLQKYDTVKNFYSDAVRGKVKASEKKGRQSRDRYEQMYIDMVRKVNRRMREMERDGLGYTDDGEAPIAILKLLYDSLQTQGIQGKSFPVNPTELPPSADISEIVKDFAVFINSELTTKKSRREYEKAAEGAFMDRGMPGHDYFSSIEPLSKKQKLVLAYWVSVYGNLRNHAFLVSDQIVEAVVILDNAKKLKAGMGAVRDIQRIVTAYEKNPEGSRSFIGYLNRALTGQLKYFRL